MLILQRQQDTATIVQTKQAKEASDKAAKQAKQEAADASQAKADTDTKLTAANSKIDDLDTQLKAAQQQAADANAGVQKANDAAKTAQDALDAINKTLGGETPDQYKADKAKAEADLAAAQSEEKILQDQLQASQQQVADLHDAINRSKTGTMPPGISGKVTFVDRAWNFVILDVGLSNGVVPNGELIVYRGRSFLGKIRVTKADPNDAVAEILPDSKADIQIGDSVLN
jgi:chromosome segregation ATPase